MDPVNQPIEVKEPTNQPNSEVTNQPNSEVTNQPNSEVTNQPTTRDIVVDGNVFTVSEAEYNYLATLGTKAYLESRNKPQEEMEEKEPLDINKLKQEIEDLKFNLQREKSLEKINNTFKELSDKFPETKADPEFAESVKTLVLNEISKGSRQSIEEIYKSKVNKFKHVVTKEYVESKIEDKEKTQTVKGTSPGVSDEPVTYKDFTSGKIRRQALADLRGPVNGSGPLTKGN